MRAHVAAGVITLLAGAAFSHLMDAREARAAPGVAVALPHFARTYGFLALTDHNRLSLPSQDASLLTPELTLVPGEEVSMYVHGLQLHANALCTRAVITGGEFPTAVRDATHPSHEQLWDDALTAGHDLMAVAVDDTHHLATDADPEAFPGVAWVEVFADAPSERVLCDALRQGALYASTGEELRSVEVTSETYEVAAVDPDATVVFVGDGGRTLARSQGGETATYRLQGDEGYVRARIEGARGFAWTPAVIVTRKL